MLSDKRAISEENLIKFTHCSRSSRSGLEDNELSMFCLKNK